MNSEDLNQIRVIVNEEIGATESRLREEIGASEARLLEEIKASEARSQEFARDIETHLLKEMQRGFDRLDRRFESFERRVERVEYENVGLSRSVSRSERNDTDTAATLAAQQRAIDDLYRQVAEIKRNLPPPSQH